MFDIKKVFASLKCNCADAFLNEAHLKIEFVKALIENYPKTNRICFEWYYLKKRVDLYAEIEGECLIFEFKYFTKKQQCILINNTPKIETDLKNHISKDLCRIHFWKDIQRIESITKANKSFKGFSILITNDVSIFDPLTSGMDVEFDISNGPHNQGNKKYYNKQGILKHDVTIKENYLFKNDFFNKYLRFLIVPIK